MVEDSQEIEVVNMTNHKVGYNLADENIHRTLQPNEHRKIIAGELRKLNYQKGGHILLTDFLSVKNEELAKEFGIDVEEQVEYNWTSEDIDRVLIEGTYDELMDAMDFAPEGIKQQLAARAVQLQINDSNKRKIISDNSPYDIDAQIKNVEKATENEHHVESKPRQRRSTEATRANKERRVQKD